MNSTALLALIGDLYAQLDQAQQEIARLRAEAADKAGDVPPPKP